MRTKKINYCKAYKHFVYWIRVLFCERVNNGFYLKVAKQLSFKVPILQYDRYRDTPTPYKHHSSRKLPVCCCNSVMAYHPSIKNSWAFLDISEQNFSGVPNCPRYLPMNKLQHLWWIGNLFMAISDSKWRFFF
jgi:hypothetical protein